MSVAIWGIVATIKAPTEDVLRFVAYHLDLGAATICIFLDDCNLQTAEALRGNARVQVILTDDAHWQKTIGRKPKKHQVRQVRNASYFYRRAKDLDWVAHIDVDEFICTDVPVAEALANCPEHISVLRMFPAESLCTDGRDDLDPDITYCKARLPGGPEGKRLESLLYPHFGGVLRSGFVSHLAGKIFVRTGRKNVKFGIHRAFENQDDVLKSADADGLTLCHKHIESWDKWLAIMTFRLNHGSYRSELEQSLDPSTGRIQRHQLFTGLTANGTKDLRAFFEEVCWATPRLRAALDEHGFLRQYRLDLDRKRAEHFPDFQ